MASGILPKRTKQRSKREGSTPENEETNDTNTIYKNGNIKYMMYKKFSMSKLRIFALFLNALGWFFIFQRYLPIFPTFSFDCTMEATSLNYIMQLIKCD